MFTIVLTYYNCKNFEKIVVGKLARVFRKFCEVKINLTTYLILKKLWGNTEILNSKKIFEKFCEKNLRRF